MAKPIQFTWNGKRRTLRLGKLSERKASRIRELIELAIEAENDSDTIIHAKLRQLRLEAPSEPVNRLIAMGLLSAGDVPVTLEALIDHYAKTRTDVKPATQEVWRQAKKSLVEFFGADCNVTKMNAGQAADFKTKLLSTKARHKSTTMKESTVKKRLDFARQVLDYAEKHEVLASNPFADVKASGAAAADHAEVTRDMLNKVLEECSPDWRLILSLCRYGGLRCPSEVLSLKWSDINWHNETMVVTSPKTEHHAGKDKRIVPLYPELRSELEVGFEAAADGAEYVVNERHRKAAQHASGWRNVNLRTQLEKLIWRSGQQPWPYLFHSMRSSRATELLDDGHPIHIVAKWQGCSIHVLTRHYAKMRGHHIEAATRRASGAADALQSDDQSAAKALQQRHA